MKDSTSARVAGVRPTVLVLADYYLPGYKAGGPMRSISGLVEVLGDEFDFKIITSDRDQGDLKIHEGIERGRWTRVGKASVLYLRKRNPLPVLYHIQKTPHDVLYLNSFFSRSFSMWPMWMCALGILRTDRVVLAPRGEFSPGALALKRLRKRAYIALARKLPAYERVLWHASSEYEAQELKSGFGARIKTIACPPARPEEEVHRRPTEGLAVLVAMDLSSGKLRVAASGPRPVKIPGELRVVFLSRIARKKNLDGALRLLPTLKGRVSFDIYGPLEDRSYWSQCQRIMAELPATIRVQYCGAVRHEDVNLTLSSYHLLLFPTQGENYGHVILEALIAGCPVLVSDQTPWRDLEGRGVGWDLPLDQPERFQDVLQKCIDMGREEYDELSARARAVGLERRSDPDVVCQNRALFQTALARARGWTSETHGAAEGLT
jgi:glycosyltransferase involved in cell wall biosynthesis